MAEILTYDQVEICYNGVPAVQDVSFSLEEGQILGIVGESGSGKSTLIRAAMGLLGPAGLVTRGDICYREKKKPGQSYENLSECNRLNLPDLPQKELRRLCGPDLAMVFQNAGASFSPVRTVGAQLYESMTAHEAVSREAFQEQAFALLERLGFEDGQRILNSYPFELSGGMQQRVGIAAAMLLHPAILLADEPTSALDVSIQKQAAEEMLQIRREFGTAIVLVTHNIGLVRFMADQVLVMKEGRMVEYGPVRQVLEAPAQEYTKKLLSAVPRLVR